MKVLLDTNVLFSAFTAEGLCHVVYERCLEEHHVLTSESILTDLHDTLRAKAELAADHARAIVAAARLDAETVEFNPLPTPVCRDPDDDAVLACALAARADVLVTGDQDLLVLKTFRGIPIVTPRTFLEMIRQRD